MNDMMEKDCCYYCGGHQFEHQLISHLQPYQGKDFLFTNVPAKVCMQCGEPYSTPETHDMILRAVQRETPTRIEPIAVFDLSEERKTA